MTNFNNSLRPEIIIEHVELAVRPCAICHAEISYTSGNSLYFHNVYDEINKSS